MSARIRNFVLNNTLHELEDTEWLCHDLNVVGGLPRTGWYNQPYMGEDHGHCPVCFEVICGFVEDNHFHESYWYDDLKHGEFGLCPACYRRMRKEGILE